VSATALNKQKKQTLIDIANKYNIKYVPKILIVDDNDKVKEITGDFSPENIINQDIEKSLNIYDENKYNIIDDDIYDENIYDENNYNILEDEMLKNKKNHILIFLSKTCSKCLDYLQHIAPSVEKEFGKEFEVETIYIEDKSKIKYLKEFNIQNVPQAFVKYDNSMYFMVIPEVNNDNIKKTIKDIKDFNEKKKMDTKLNSETDFKNIMNLYSSIAYNDTDKNTNKNSDDTELLIFLSKKCDTCKDYEKNIYPKIEKEFLNKCKLRKLYYEDNKKIFEDYGVQNVPLGIISMKDKYIPIEDSIAREFLNKLFPGIFKNN
jgi:thiol-disulfide isomerase/thioredoxin